VVIADDKRTKPLVALASPDRPTVVLSNPEQPAAKPAEPAPKAGQEVAAAAPPAAPGAPPKAPDPAAQPAPRAPVKIAAIDAEEGGRLFVSGQAAPGATVRLYLNDTLIAPGGAGADGKVGFQISRGVRPGSYRVRLDDVDPLSGEVKSRAEVAFAMPVEVAVPLPPQATPLVTGPRDVAAARPPNGHAAQRDHATEAASAGAAATPAARPSDAAAAAQRGEPQRTGDRGSDPSIVLVPEINTAIVARGDNLWNISRRIYGHGLRYTVIYGANQPQIRDPDLIYPGQVFVLPGEQGRTTQR
jgi:nucleoid-associated protein YgaU